MPLVFPYCTLEDVQKETRNDDGNKAAWFEECINNASRTIDDWCRRDFLYHDHSSDPLKVSHKYIAGKEVHLPWPVISISEAKIDGVVESPKDYRKEGSSIYFRSLLPDDPVDLKVAIKGAFGYEYADDAEPAEKLPWQVRRACTLIASAFTVQLRREIVTPDGSGAESILETRVTKEAQMLLKKHKRRFL